MKIHVAGITCQILSPDAEFLAELEDRYSAFLVSDTMKAEVAIEAVPQADGYSLRENQQDQDATDPMVQVVEEGGAYRIRRFDNPFEALVDFSTGIVQVKLYRNLYCFDSFLRILFSMLLARVEGALIHSVAIKFDHGGALFIGVSGSGKTTLGGLTTDKVLSDELVAVRRIDGAFYAFSTPFWGEFVAGKVNDKAKLEAIYLLKKDSENFISPVKQSRAMQEILGCTFFFGPAQYSGSMLDISVNLTSEIAVQELHFRPVREVFDVIKKGVVEHVI